MSSTDSDRGRSADRPSDIPATGWRDILWRVWAQIGEDNISIVAAGVAFYVMLAAFSGHHRLRLAVRAVRRPAIRCRTQFANLKGIIPDDAWSLLNDQLTAVVSARPRQPRHQRRGRLW